MADPAEPVVRRLLATVRVASPCKESWEQMTGDQRVRACARCAKKVYDLSAMTADEAEAMLADPAVECVRFYRRADGRIMTSDCPDASRQRRQRRVATMAAAAMAAGVAGGVAAAWAVREPVPAAQPDCPAAAAAGVSGAPAAEPIDEPIDEPGIEHEVVLGRMVAPLEQSPDYSMGMK